MANGAGLSRHSAPFDVYLDVKIGRHVDRNEWLTDDHAASLASEVFVQRRIIDNDITGAPLQKYARCGTFPAPGAVVDFGCHTLKALIELVAARHAGDQAPRRL